MNFISLLYRIFKLYVKNNASTLLSNFYILCNFIALFVCFSIYFVFVYFTCVKLNNIYVYLVETVYRSTAIQTQVKLFTDATYALLD